MRISTFNFKEASSELSRLSYNKVSVFQQRITLCTSSLRAVLWLGSSWWPWSSCLYTGKVLSLAVVYVYASSFAFVIFIAVTFFFSYLALSSSVLLVLDLVCALFLFVVLIFTCSCYFYLFLLFSFFLPYLMSLVLSLFLSFTVHLDTPLVLFLPFVAGHIRVVSVVCTTGPIISKSRNKSLSVFELFKGSLCSNWIWPKTNLGKWRKRTFSFTSLHTTTPSIPCR